MILITNQKNTRFGKYDGFSTNLLIGRANSDCDEISIQITDIEPKGMQFMHSHPEAQCYYIIHGTGTIIIDDEEAEVMEGDAVFIPGNSLHGIKNAGSDTLKYLTANKAFSRDKELQTWPRFTDSGNQ